MILSHQSIKSLLGKVIKNYSEESVRENGYDLRLCGDYVLKVVGNPFLPSIVAEVERVPFGDELEMEPLTTYLFESCEELEMPNDLAAVMTLRSTLARNGFLIPPTVIDAGYRGKITIALTPTKRSSVEKGMRAIHLVFLRLDQPTEKPYSGKYLGGVMI
ncbi:MAG: dCTP deaminase [Thermoprotei archaeon]